MTPDQQHVDRCESHAPIVKFDTGPIICSREKGHEGHHHARDYEREVYPQESWRVWDDEGRLVP